jgi:hypothetical protein
VSADALYPDELARGLTACEPEPDERDCPADCPATGCDQCCDGEPSPEAVAELARRYPVFRPALLREWRETDHTGDCGDCASREAAPGAAPCNDCMHCVDGAPCRHQERT